MSVFPGKPNALVEIFGQPKVLIGVIHSLPLPGSPHYAGESVESVYEFAVEEAQAYADGGFHGIIVENAWDLPFAKPEDIGQETGASMAVMADRVRQQVDIPIGINVLANGVHCSLAVATASEAAFVRANQWVNAYVANEGFVEGPAASATRYRKWLQAEDVKVFADVHVKHGSHAIVADRTVDEQARDAEFFDADVLIATGNRTGDATPVEEIRAIQAGTDLPVIVGSGLHEGNAQEILGACDGAIVASSVKENEAWWGRVERARVEKLASIGQQVWNDA